MNTNTKNNLVGSLILALCAFIWGCAFVAQTKGAEFIEPFTFIAIRSFLASAFLVPVILIIDKTKKKKGTYKKLETKEEKRFFALGSLACGVCVCVASVLQQLGLDRGTEPGRAGFITALYILMVPIFSIVLKKKIRPIIWLCVAISIGGLYLLCVNDSRIAPSDFYVLACAVCYSVHILVIDYVSPRVDGVKLSCVQFIISGIIASVPMMLFEEVSFELLRSAAVSVLYAGIMSSGVAYTLQIVGQAKMSQPTVASMIMSLESVFAVLAGMVILHQIPSAKEAAGCVLMFAAIIIAQLPSRKNEKIS